MGAEEPEQRWLVGPADLPDGVNGAAERAELGALLELCCLPNSGPARLRALLSTRSALAALQGLRRGDVSTLRELAACRGVNAALIETWRRCAVAAFDRIGGERGTVGDDLLKAHERSGTWLHLPQRQLDTEPWASDPEPPAVLFGQGAPVSAGLRRVGIVGARRCSAYGRGVAHRLGEGLASHGVAVVSGLATGVDGIAQGAALDAGGPVIGVVGSGLDRVYPPSNRELWADMARHGTLLSEYPLGTRADRWRFPARNRILAALSEVLVVVESGPTGGSMYTVDAAAERGRSVMAVPGRIDSEKSLGPNRLLRDGCAPVCDLDDVLLALEASSSQTAAAPFSLPSRASAKREARSEHDSQAATVAAEMPQPEPPTDPLDRRILDELTAGAASFDELARRTEAALGKLASSLGRLQLSGRVQETGGWWERSA